MSTIIHTGDCRVILPTIPDNSIDSIVTDPPYELGFMGKSWDSTGIAYDVTVWQQCLRVLKPGGHIIAFGGSRTYHRLAVAIEDAGFEIRDQIQWIYGSGFPKSLDVSKAIDKKYDAIREIVSDTYNDMFGEYEVKKIYKAAVQSGVVGGINNSASDSSGVTYAAVTKPVTENAVKWDGWGTSLKPSHEPAVLARKPMKNSVIENVLQYGVGAINIDACRLQYENNNSADIDRWPANVIIDEYIAHIIDQQSIGSSRFFYIPKASTAEREAGLYNHKKTKFRNMNGQQRKDGSFQEWLPDPKPRANTHPTVKPITLMRYLIRMITPYGGIVLDPFTGSGSTGCAAVIENCSFVGMDITPEYVDIAKKRIDYYSQQLKLDIEV
jgi:DNA modification methylase